MIYVNQFTSILVNDVKCDHFLYVVSIKIYGSFIRFQDVLLAFLSVDFILLFCIKLSATDFFTLRLNEREIAFVYFLLFYLNE